MLSGEKLREARKKRGFTQEKLAEQIGTSQQQIHRWEHGQQPTSVTDSFS